MLLLLVWLVRVREEDVSDMAPKSEERKDLYSFPFIRKMVVERIIVHDKRISKQNGAIHFMCVASLYSSDALADVVIEPKTICKTLIDIVCDEF